MIRAVLDTNVLVSALLFSGLPARLVSAWQASRFHPVLSSQILDEYLRTLAYPKFRLTPETIRTLAEEQSSPFLRRSVSKSLLSQCCAILMMRNSLNARWRRQYHGL